MISYIGKLDYIGDASIDGDSPGGGGGVPEWLPVGALAHFDYLEERYYSGGGVRAEADLVVRVSGTIGEDGFVAGGSAPFSTELLEADMTAGSMCLVYQWLDLSGADTRILATLENEDQSLGCEILLNADYTITVSDYNGAYTVSIGLVLAGEVNKLAISWTDIGTLHFSLNGETAITDIDTVDALDSVDIFTIWTIQADGALQFLTIYAEKAAADLPALSALGGGEGETVTHEAEAVTHDAEPVTYEA